MYSKEAKISSVIMFYLTVVSLFFISAGCNSPTDPNASVGASEFIEAAEPLPRPSAFASRDWPSRTADYVACRVSHPTLYMQDPLENSSSSGGRFQIWSLNDVVSLVASPAIFGGNIIAMPVAAVLDPPFSCQSDRSGYPLAPGAYNIPFDPAGKYE